MLIVCTWVGVGDSLQVNVWYMPVKPTIPCGCWKLNLGPLKELPALLTTKLSLQPPPPPQWALKCSKLTPTRTTAWNPVTWSFELDCTLINWDCPDLLEPDLYGSNLCGRDRRTANYVHGSSFWHTSQYGLSSMNYNQKTASRRFAHPRGCRSFSVAESTYSLAQVHFQHL